LHCYHLFSQEVSPHPPALFSARYTCAAVQPIGVLWIGQSCVLRLSFLFI